MFNRSLLAQLIAMLMALLVGLLGCIGGWQMIQSQLAANAADALVMYPAQNHLLLAFMGLFILVLGAFLTGFAIFAMFKVTRSTN